MFGENSFASWVTRKIIFDFLGWLVWIPANLVFISFVMILKKKLKKLVWKSKLPCLPMLKLSKTQLTALLWIVLKLVRLVWIFQSNDFWSHEIASIKHFLVIGLSQSLKKNTIINKNLVTSQWSLKIYPWPAQHVLTSSPNFSFIVSFGNFLWWQTSQDSSTWLCKLQLSSSHSSISSLP